MRLLDECMGNRRSYVRHDLGWSGGRPGEVPCAHAGNCSEAPSNGLKKICHVYIMQF